MRIIFCFFLLFCIVLPPNILAQDVDAVLDDFHDAASQADAERYFGHFTDHAVFFGTDITERWTVDEFKAYAMPFFNEGRGWTYVKQSRHVFHSDDGDTAWFDEILLNENFGETRGTGVLLHTEDGWKIAQYHLTLPVPNNLIYDLVEMIEAQQTEEND